MEIKVLTEDKNFIELEINSVTIAELLRVYLNKQDVRMAAWRRDHPTKNPILRVEADNAKKIVLGAIEAIQKDLDGFISDFKKLK